MMMKGVSALNNAADPETPCILGILFKHQSDQADAKLHL